MGFWDCSERLALARAQKARRGALDGEVELSLQGGGESAPGVFAGHLSSIKIGREDGWADFVTPKTELRISRRHMELRRQASGHWEAVPQGTSYTALNGRPLSAPKLLVPGDVLTLGVRDGPQLRFERRARADAAGAPKAQPTPAWVTATQAVIHDAEDLLCLHMRKVVAAFAVVAVALAGLGGYAAFDRFERNQVMATLMTQVGDYRAEQQRLAAGFDSDRLRLAAHLVIASRGPGQEKALASSWPISTTQMVTNAHVAVELEKMRARGIEVFVLGPAGEGGQPTRHRVTGLRVHPGHAAFQDFLGSLGGDLGMRTLDGDFQASPLPRAYDLALLELETPVDPSRVLTPRNLVEAPLGATEELAFGGYLIEGIDGCDTLTRNPVPHIQYGRISKVTDFFMFPPSDGSGTGFVISHSVPITGGASGGPLVDMQGRLVGVVTSGTIFGTSSGGAGSGDLACSASDRQPSAAMVNFAQSGDLAAQLLEGTFDEAAARRIWNDARSRFAEPEKAMEDSYIASMTRGRNARVERVSEETVEAAGQFGTHVVPLEVEPGAEYAVLVYARGREPLGAMLRIDGATKQLDDGRAPRFRFTATAGGADVVIVTNFTAAAKFSVKLYRIQAPPAS